MERAALHDIWAPAASRWSPWVKAVPFAFWPRTRKNAPSSPRSTFDEAVFPDVSLRTALVVELPGSDSVRCGAWLATRGYRPVPVFASAPSDWESMPSAVDAADVIAALGEAADVVAAADVPADAPPAFLVDARRHAPGLALGANYFDNRSALFASDFPSAETLARERIQRVLIVRDAGIVPSRNLVHALGPWRRAGLTISAIDVNGSAVTLRWPVTGAVGAVLHRARLLFTLKANSRGGYGRLVSESSSG